jgi:hypothetical protein
LYREIAASINLIISYLALPNLTYELGFLPLIINDLANPHAKK